MFDIRKRLAKLAYRLLYRIDPPFFRQQHPYADWVTREPGYEKLYEEGLKKTGARPSVWRKDKFYNLYGAFGLVADTVEGDVVECGAYRGHSSYILCHLIKEKKPAFDGTGYHIFDSFEGLSAPIGDDRLGQGVKGLMAAGVDVVRETLKEFPGIAYHQGWIPESLHTQPGRRYRFVHVDVDLVEPTLGAFEYFFPRMAPGGIIVCDDYASVRWPGTKGAIDAFCDKHHVKKIALSSCQLIVFA